MKGWRGGGVPSHWPVWLVLLLPAAGGNILAAETLKPAGRELKYEEPKLLAGAIYARDSKQLLFNFKRVANRSGSALKVQRDFTYPAGKLAAQERVVYEGDDLVSFELDEAQTGASGSAKIQRTPGNPAKGSIDFEYTAEPGGRPKTRSEPLREDTLVGDMVEPFLVSHWNALHRGEKVKCRYIVVPRRETVGFTFSRDSEALQKGQRVLVVKMEASSRILAALVDPLFFTMEEASPHRVLQYVGRTTPKIQVGGKWKDLDALTVFDWDSAR
jgi:hypothetical protein